MKIQNKLFSIASLLFAIILPVAMVKSIFTVNAYTLTTPITPPITSPTPTSTPFIKVLTPNGGESLTFGSKYLITWQSYNAGQIMIDLVDSDGKFSTIALPMQASAGSYSWTLPLSWYGASRQFKIKVYEYPNAGLVDYSDNYFTIGNTTPTLTPTPTAIPTPYIRLIKPNGGEVLSVGQTIQINWQSVGTTRVALYLSTDPNGYNTYGIAYNIPDSKSYTWTVNNFGLPSNTKFYIRVSGFYNNANDAVYDASDNYFTIIAPSVTPTVTPTITPTPTPTSTYCLPCYGRMCPMRSCTVL